MLKKLLCVTSVVMVLVCVDISLVADEIKEVVFIGNSIRWHGKAPQLGWNNDWGMAATSRDKDYVHVLYRHICDKLTQKQSEPPKLVLPGSIEEKDFSRWDPSVTRNADIIIVQLGDNYRNPVTVENLQKPYEAMLKDYRGNRNPIIICVSSWGRNAKMDELIKNAAINQGAKFVSLEKIAADPLNSAGSEGHFSHGGVKWHPGDCGMKAIADAIWQVLEPELDQVCSSADPGANAGNILGSNLFSKESGWDFYVHKDKNNTDSYVKFDNGKAIVYGSGYGAEEKQRPHTYIQVTRKNLALDTGKKYIVRVKADISKPGYIHVDYQREKEKMQDFFWYIFPGKTDYEFTLEVKDLSETKEKLSGILFLFLGGLKDTTLSISDISISDANAPVTVSPQKVKQDAKTGEVIYSVSGDSWPGWAAKPSNCQQVVSDAKQGKCVKIGATGEGESEELGNRDVLGKVAKAKSFIMTACVGEILEKYKGYEIEIEVGVKGENIPANLKPWEGVSISTSYVTDTYTYNHCYYNTLSGTFDWQTITFRTRIPDDMSNMNLTLGLIAQVGMVYFDHLKITTTGVPRSMEKAPAGELYKGHKLPRLRGLGTGIREPGNENGKKSISMLGRDWKVNVISLWFGEKGSFADSDADLDKWMDSVEKSLPTARESGLYLILKFSSNWNNKEHGGNSLFFEKPEYADKLVEHWKTVAKRFKGCKEIYAFVLQNELQLRMPIAKGCLDYPGLMERTAKAINEVDPERAIIVQPEEWWSTRAFYKLRPLNAKNVIYSVHFYSPFEVTHQGVDAFMSKQKSWERYSYPGVCKGKKWDKEMLRRDLQPVIDFQKAYNVHIFVDEFSCIRWAPDNSRYNWVNDTIDLFEELGWDWVFHAYPEWPGWDPRLGTDPWNEKKPDLPTETEKLLKNWFSKNTKPMLSQE